MSDSAVTRGGIEGARPGRDATVGVNAGRRRRGGEQPMVPDAEFTSYYGKPIINGPVWESPDIPGYLFLGGLAGAGSVVALGADLTGRAALARASKVAALGAISLGMVGLVHDLGRPKRFINMLRVFKPTSPMNVGSWALAAYGPAAAVSAGSAVTGVMPRVGAAATGAAAAVGPFVAAYTAALVCDTAVPAWHDAYREMPFLFVGSGASAAGGVGLLAAPLDETGPVLAVAAAGAVVETAMTKLIERRLGSVAEPYHDGTSGRLMHAAEALAAASVVAGVAGRGRRWLTRAAGAGFVTASALARFGIFEAGLVSADTPEHTVQPQRQRLQAGDAANAPAVSRADEA